MVMLRVLPMSRSFQPPGAKYITGAEFIVDSWTICIALRECPFGRGISDAPIADVSPRWRKVRFLTNISGPDEADPSAASGGLDTSGGSYRERTLSGPLGKVVFFFGALGAAFHVYVLLVQAIQPWFLRSFHLTIAASLVFILIFQSEQTGCIVTKEQRPGVRSKGQLGDHMEAFT